MPACAVKHDQKLGTYRERIDNCRQYSAINDVPPVRPSAYSWLKQGMRSCFPFMAARGVSRMAGFICTKISVGRLLVSDSSLVVRNAFSDGTAVHDCQPHSQYRLSAKPSMLMRTWRVQDLTSSMMAHLRLSFNNEQASDERVRHPQCSYNNTLRCLLLVHNALAFFG